MTTNNLDLAIQEAASVCMRNTNNVWINDHAVSDCHGCNIAFGIFVRKHHCRNCGNIFCYQCTDNYVVIPSFITDRPNPADYWNLAYYISSLRGKKERVCAVCYRLIEDRKRSQERIFNIFQNPINLVAIRTLPDTDRDIKTHYFDHLRNIQYYLPNHKYSDIDQKILQINADFFTGHSKYTVHLIKSIDWRTASEKRTEQVMNVLRNVKTHTCLDLYCTRTCGDVLSCDDCMTILYSCVRHLPKVILIHLFSILSATSERVILCHLPFFITLIKTDGQLNLIQLIYSVLCKTTKLTYHTFWFLNNSKEEATYQELTNINNFLRSLSNQKPDLVKTMQIEYQFYENLVKQLDNPKPYLVSYFHNAGAVSLPYDPDVKLIGGAFDQITIKTSHTKPVIIPFYTNVGTQINLLFKRECIMNDVAVLNLMTLCGIILNGTFGRGACENKSADSNMATTTTTESTMPIPSTPIQTQAVVISVATAAPVTKSMLISEINGPNGFNPKNSSKSIQQSIQQSSQQSIQQSSQQSIQQSIQNSPNLRSCRFPYDVVVYPVMPLTANSGMIKIVEDAETLHNILTSNTTISNYIISKNEDKVISDVLNRYMYSLVAYTLHSYFIGLGDRHQQNIMITHDGAIFHIDFGYILGKDSYPMAAYNVRLSSDMLDILGGVNGNKYIQYLELCAHGVVVLRKYFNMFFILLNQNLKIQEEHIEKFIMSRFQPRQSDDVVIREFMNIIEKSHDAYHDAIRDFFHYHTQEKTVQNGVTKAIKSAVWALKSLTVDPKSFQ